MSITTELRRTVEEARSALGDPKPLHAVAGAGDLVVERVRTAVAAQQKALQSARFEPSAVPTLVNSTVDNVRGAIVGFPNRAQDVVVESVVRANHTYDDLAKRGASLVRRISRQRASQEFADQVENTVRAARATRTTAQTASASTVSRARATATSARKAAAAAGAVATASATKTGAAGTTRTRVASPARKTTTPRKTSTTAKKASTTAKKARTTTTKSAGSTARTASTTAKKASTTAKKASTTAKKTSTTAKRASARKTSSNA